MVSWLMGSRDSNCAYQFLRDLRTRVQGRPQITERQNLTNAFTKKFENQAYMLAIYFVHYNWMIKHKTLGTTPAIAAGLTPNQMTMADIVQLIDSRRSEMMLTTRSL